MIADQVLIEALNLAGLERMFVPGETKLKAALKRAIRCALNDIPAVTVRATETTFNELKKGWTRPPGGVDIVAELADGSGLLLMELKVCKPEEAPWDALKLADLGRLLPETNAAYLVYVAREKGWSADLPGADLFLGDAERRWCIRKMIERWPGAWVQLLRGGKGIRPRRSTAEITVTRVAEVSLDADEGYVVQAVRVAPADGADEQEFDQDGWPIEYDPPEDLRALGRAADEAQRAEDQRRLADAEPDECHGYPWLKRWEEYWLGVVIAQIICANPDAPDALSCLKRRLKNERDWTDQDLHAKVDRLVENLNR